MNTRACTEKALELFLFSGRCPTVIMTDPVSGSEWPSGAAIGVPANDSRPRWSNPAPPGSFRARATQPVNDGRGCPVHGFTLTWFSKAKAGYQVG
jgi:hypothetical protein